MPPIPVRLRAAVLDDVPALVELGARTFEETYAAGNDPRELAAQIRASYTEEVVGAALRRPGTTYVAAETDGVLVGFARLVVPSHEDGIDALRPAELNQLYVDSGQHGRGTGRALIADCLDRARRAGSDVLWLGVWEHNARAIAFYERLGFRRAGTHPFLFGAEWQTDLLMVWPLDRV